MPCFDRSDETKALWSQFQAGRNLLMLAPRRIGKTVLLNHLRESAAAQGFRAIVLDVEGVRDEKAFFRECCAAIQEELSTGTKVMSAFAHLAMDRLLELDKRLYWASWREHLDRNFTDPDRARLYLVLETVAKVEDGANVNLLLGVLNQRGEPISELALRDLVDTLLADGYLVLGTDGRYRFMMHLLREWWLRYVVL